MGRTLQVLSRLILGCLFIFSGTVKAIDPIGSAIKVGEYLHSFGLEGWGGTEYWLSYALCVFEVVLGVFVITGAFRRVTATLLLLTMLGMTALTFYIWQANPVADCGCFGDALKISNKATFVKNLVFLLPTVYLFWKRKDIYPLLPRSTHFLQLLLIVGGMGWFVYNSIAHLPPVDFRPYKVGVSLTTPPDEGDEDSSEYKFVYRKNGEERTFTLDELAGVDSTWTYVRQEGNPEPDKRSVVASTADFRLYNTKNEDITTAVLSSPKVALILISDLHALKSWTNRKQDLQSFNSIISTHGGVVYFVIGGGISPEQDNLLSHLCPYVSLARMDATTMKTIIRSNPGIMLLQNGVIVRKISGTDIVKEIQTPLFKNEPFAPLSWERWAWNLFRSFLPLVLLGATLLIGVVIAWRKSCTR